MSSDCLLYWLILLFITSPAWTHPHESDGHEYGAYSKYGDLGNRHTDHNSGWSQGAWSGAEKGYAGWEKDGGEKANQEHAGKYQSHGHYHAAKANHGKEKHEDAHSDYGKEHKANTFGYFEHRYKQPEFHVEQFHTEEEHGKKYGDDQHAVAVADHGHDHAAQAGHSGWSDHHDKDAHGHAEYAKGDHDHSGHDDGHQKQWHSADHGAYDKDHGDHGSHHESSHHHEPEHHDHYYGHGHHGYGHGHGHGWHPGYGHHHHGEHHHGDHHHGGYGHHGYGEYST